MKTDWARKRANRALDAYYYERGETADAVIARVLKSEHRRAVRVVEKAREAGTKGCVGAYVDGYEAACADILAALKRGRT